MSWILQGQSVAQSAGKPAVSTQISVTKYTMAENVQAYLTSVFAPGASRLRIVALVKEGQEPSEHLIEDVIASLQDDDSIPGVQVTLEQRSDMGEAFSQQNPCPGRFIEVTFSSPKIRPHPSIYLANAVIRHFLDTLQSWSNCCSISTSQRLQRKREYSVLAPAPLAFTAGGV